MGGFFQSWKVLYSCISCLYLVCWWSLSWWAVAAVIGYWVRTGSFWWIWGFDFSIVFKFQTQMYWAIEALQVLHTILGLLLPKACPSYFGNYQTDEGFSFAGGAVSCSFLTNMIKGSAEEDDKAKEQAEDTA